MRLQLTFSHHAAQRWFERCSHLDFGFEMSQLKRCKQSEKKAVSLGYPATKVYLTRSGIKLVTKDNLVITVLHGVKNWHFNKGHSKDRRKMK